MAGRHVNGAGHNYAGGARHAEAVLALIAASACWGLSFPLMKALYQSAADAGSSNGFLIAAQTLGLRFAVATVILAALTGRRLGGLTALELRQGVALGLALGLGTLFQMDGLGHTLASTSAFLTQFYVVLVPLYLLVRQRRQPTAVTVFSCGLVIIGMAVLCRLDLRKLLPGRGELETLVGAVFFTWQILLLDRPQFAGNDMQRVTVVMFAAIAVLFVPTLWADNGAGTVPWRDPGWLWLMTGLVVGPTLVAFSLMNHWQPLVHPTQASIIYCIEPVFASVYALFVPGWISRVAGLEYPNETLTASLWLGGGLITVANVLIQLGAAERQAAGR